jgi:hypothetical protein
MKEWDSGDWKQVDESFSIDLKRRRYELILRTMNLAGVTGPEHKIVISRN